MVFTKFVEVGRVVLITKGPNAGKIAVIVEIVDHNNAVIDGPTTGVIRQVISYRRVTLTDLKVKKLPRGARTKTVEKAFKNEKIVEQWQNTPLAKKLEAKKRRSELNDFERFKVMVLKQQKQRILQSS